MVESAFASLAGTGVVGVVLALCLLALRKKDQDYRDEVKAHLDDNLRFTNILLDLGKETRTAVIALGDVTRKQEQREEERERLEHELAMRPQTAQPFKPVGGE